MFSFQGLEQRSSTVYKGILISGGWNRRVPLYIYRYVGGWNRGVPLFHSKSVFFESSAVSMVSELLSYCEDSEDSHEASEDYKMCA